MASRIMDDAMTLEIGNCDVAAARLCEHTAADCNDAWIVSTHPARVNPARSLGPDIVGNDCTGWWVYVAGPVIGAVLAVAIIGAVRGLPDKEETRRRGRRRKVAPCRWLAARPGSEVSVMCCPRPFSAGRR
jgi:hypothetical protein